VCSRLVNPLPNPRRAEYVGVRLEKWSFSITVLLVNFYYSTLTPAHARSTASAHSLPCSGALCAQLSLSSTAEYIFSGSRLCYSSYTSRFSVRKLARKRYPAFLQPSWRTCDRRARVVRLDVLTAAFPSPLPGIVEEAHGSEFCFNAPR